MLLAACLCTHLPDSSRQHHLNQLPSHSSHLALASSSSSSFFIFPRDYRHPSVAYSKLHFFCKSFPPSANGTGLPAHCLHKPPRLQTNSHVVKSWIKCLCVLGLCSVCFIIPILKLKKYKAIKLSASVGSGLKTLLDDFQPLQAYNISTPYNFLATCCIEGGTIAAELHFRSLHVFLRVPFSSSQLQLAREL